MDYSNATNEKLEQLAGQKDGDAICELGERCMYGTKGHTKNLTRAYQLFHKGEKLGLKRAYLGLAQMYEAGIYFAKSEELADEYYRKAGGKVKQDQEIVPPQTGQLKNKGYFSEPEANRTVDGMNVPGINTFDIRGKIDNAKNARSQGDFAQAKAQCNEALKMIESINTGIVSYTGSEDLDVLKIDAYWLLAYIAFNEQQVTEMEKYLAKEGVQALHPWGVYLAAVVHKNSNQPDVVLEQDLQTLIMVSQNQNLSVEERGDTAMMIAELILCGYGKSAGCTVKTAYDYFSQAAGYGNAYAKDQLARFEMSATGEMIFNG